VVLSCEQADRGIAGRMEGHANMGMSVEGGSLWQRITSPQVFTAIYLTHPAGVPVWEGPAQRRPR